MTRREFMASAALAGAAGIVSGAKAAERREIRVGVVGCGGRGTGGAWKPKSAEDYYKFGALGNMMQAAENLRKEGADVTVKPVAFADYFLDKAKFAAEKFGVDAKFAFGGANGYKQVMAMPEVDVVILTTPLNFRPIHTMAAVKAGKHVFAEKGVAVDAPGVRLMIEASKLAAEKRLTVVCGTAGCLGCASARPSSQTRTISATTGSTSPSFRAIMCVSSMCTTSMSPTGLSGAIPRRCSRLARVRAA